jgi:hypothetical protein
MEITQTPERWPNASLLAKSDVLQTVQILSERR